MKKLTSWSQKTGCSPSIEKQCRDIREQIERLEAERNDLQRELNGISDLFTETTRERGIRIGAEARVEVLNSYIKTAEARVQILDSYIIPPTQG